MKSHNSLVTTINKKQGNEFKVKAQDLKTNQKNFIQESNLDFEFHNTMCITMFHKISQLAPKSET